jgi:dTDP-4-dehydrorhamnose reductase
LGKIFSVKSMKHKEVLITGGNGTVGTYFSQYKNAYVATRKDFDIRDSAQVNAFIRKNKPKTIIHLAAMTNVDECEKNPVMAYETNLGGTLNIAKAAATGDIHLIYVSTSGVFEGNRRTPYSTKHRPSPLSVYTRSKYLAEIACRDIVPRLTIARAGWVFGGGEFDKKFIGMMTRQLQSGVKELKAVSDVYGCPTYAHDLAQALWGLHEESKYGLFHIVNKGHASRYQIAEEIIKILKSQAMLIPASVHDFPAFAAPRPKFEVIKPNLKLRSWKKALKEYLHSWNTIA